MTTVLNEKYAKLKCFDAPQVDGPKINIRWTWTLDMANASI